jgi:3-oxoacyl-[acyl-carrier-protein] synthase III
MLINAGIYREDSMGEPALAALIQEDIGANPGEPPVGGDGTFSFDLLNGACGVITAIQLESGLLRSGVIRLGAIVTSDVEPDAKLGYQVLLADCAEEATRNFLRELGMDMAEVDLLIPAPSAPGFLDPLRERLGVPGDRVAYTPED